MSYKENLEKNKILNNNNDFLEYIENHFPLLFEYDSYIMISDNFLDNYYVYNFFLNLANFIPQVSYIFYDISTENQLAVNEFFAFLRKCPSFDEFSSYKINKKVFFLIMQSIKKNLFFMYI